MPRLDLAFSTQPSATRRSRREATSCHRHVPNVFVLRRQGAKRRTRRDMGGWMGSARKRPLDLRQVAARGIAERASRPFW